MKKITLFGPTIVTVAGESAVHHPHENPLTVTNAEATRLNDAGVLACDPEDTDGVDPVEEAPAVDQTGSDGLDAMTIAKLSDLAAHEGVDLKDLTAKGDIIGAIREHRAAAAA